MVIRFITRLGIEERRNDVDGIKNKEEFGQYDQPSGDVTLLGCFGGCPQCRYVIYIVKIEL